MTWTIWAALIAGFLAVSGATALVVVRVLEAWRTLKRLNRRVGKELDRLTALTEQTAENAARAADQEKLAASFARLRAALAQFAVLRGAVNEATATFDRFTAFYPRK